MEVTFTRTGDRRYKVTVHGSGVVASTMDPAPGYDSLMPHDLAHFIVEKELGIKGGVFGQIALGGAFRPEVEKKKRKILRRKSKLANEYRDDALLSERMVAQSCSVWGKTENAAKLPDATPDEKIMSVCRKFDRVSSEWSKLPVGGSITLTWESRTKR